MNSRWSSLGAALALTLVACGSGAGGAPGVESSQAQADAEQLGREVAEIVDRVMAYRSSHRNILPPTLRQAGLDSLTPVFIRRLGRQGGDPLVTIVFRRSEGHVLASCEGTNLVLEDMLLRAGSFDVSCVTPGGDRHDYTVPPPPRPKS